MRISMTSAVVTLLSLALASTAAAQCCAGAKKTADSGATCQKDKSACSKTGYQVGKEACRDKALAAAGMPVMHYKVGDTKTACRTTAKVELAKARIETAQKALAEIAAQDQGGQEVARGA